MDNYEKIESIYASKYNKSITTRKSIGDFFLNDTHAVNVKSNDLNKNNYSPNIISASKVEKWLNGGKDLSFIFVDYIVRDNKIEIQNDTKLIPVQHISWDCLTIQAQGKGVIQKNKSLSIKESSKEEWLKGLSEAYIIFINKERIKLDKLEKKHAASTPRWTFLRSIRKILKFSLDIDDK